MAQLQPDRFEDIVALVALYRPGPLGTNMVDDFIANKHGAEIKYEHPQLENILSETNGLILYQEQVMEIARSLADYSLGDADLLRRAMGKKKKKKWKIIDQDLYMVVIKIISMKILLNQFLIKWKNLLVMDLINLILLLMHFCHIKQLI